MATITKEMTLGEVVQTYPETVNIMFKYGLHCIGCHVATWETIEQGMLAHGNTPEAVDKMVAEMNEAINEGKNLTPAGITPAAKKMPAKKAPKKKASAPAKKASKKKKAPKKK